MTALNYLYFVGLLLPLLTPLAYSVGAYVASSRAWARGDRCDLASESFAAGFLGVTIVLGVFTSVSGRVDGLALYLDWLAQLMIPLPDGVSVFPVIPSLLLVASAVLAWPSTPYRGCEAEFNRAFRLGISKLVGGTAITLMAVHVVETASRVLGASTTAGAEQARVIWTVISVLAMFAVVYLASKRVSRRSTDGASNLAGSHVRRDVTASDVHGTR